MQTDLAPVGEASGRPAPSRLPLVSIAGLTKTYGLATVLDDVSLDIIAGEVHAVVGENGAGKSTLAKCLAGLVTPTGGDIVFEGEKIIHFTVQDAERRGIVLIHQELALAEHLGVAENMFLGHELSRRGVLSNGEMRRRASEMLKRLGSEVRPNRTISSLTVPDKQIVEIAKALLREAKLIIMDEPTAVLTPRETESLFAQVKRLKTDGIGIVFVSHKLDEVKRIADRVTVLRDGRYQGTWDADDVSAADIARLMVGRDLGEIYPEKATNRSRPPALILRDFRGEGMDAPASFEVRTGEVFGVAGLIGSGRTELFESLFGLRGREGGEVALSGKAFHPATYRDALRCGCVYITEDRKGQGLLLGETIARNVSALEEICEGWLLTRPAREQVLRAEAVKRFHIDAPYPTVPVGRLSGGNQQKVLLAKSLLRQPDLIVIDEPTRGIDVGTRVQIYRLLRQLADEGRAVVVISSDLQEIVGLSDRVLVMRAGRVAGVLDGDGVTEEHIMRLATGATTDVELRS